MIENDMSDNEDSVFANSLNNLEQLTTIERPLAAIRLMERAYRHSDQSALRMAGKLRAFLPITSQMHSSDWTFMRPQLVLADDARLEGLYGTKGFAEILKHSQTTLEQGQLPVRFIAKAAETDPGEFLEQVGQVSDP